MLTAPKLKICLVPTLDKDTGSTQPTGPLISEDALRRKLQHKSTLIYTVWSGAPTWVRCQDAPTVSCRVSRTWRDLFFFNCPPDGSIRLLRNFSHKLLFRKLLPK